MLTRLFFNALPLHKQVQYLKRKGIGLGTRYKHGRKIYIYMLRNLFVEVLYTNDNSDQDAEKINIIPGLTNLNNHLENEFKNSF